MGLHRFLQLGWLLFFTTLIVMVTVGFQAPADKAGVADVNRMMTESDFGKSVQDQLQKMRTAREDLLSFIDTNRVLTVDQATRLRDLWLKPSLTPAEQAEMDSLKASIVAANKRWTALATGTNMTPEDRTLVQEYADRAQRMNQLGTRWVREFTSEIDTWLEGQKQETSTRARAAILQVAKAQGYTMVYDTVFVPYGANDITDAAIQAMNAQK